MKEFCVFVTGIGEPLLVKAAWCEFTSGCAIFWESKGRAQLVAAFAANEWTKVATK